MTTRKYVRGTEYIEIPQSIMNESPISAEPEEDPIINTLMTSQQTEYAWLPIDYDFPVANIDYRKMGRIREDWYHRLVVVRENTLGNLEMSEDKIMEFVKFLIDNQRTKNTEGDFNPESSWCIPLDTKFMPSDARVDLAYFPTYIATAFLCLVKDKLPSIANEFPNFDEKLRKGLDFSAGRNLLGHGYDAVIELLEAIEILALGDVFNYVRDNPNVSTKLVTTMSKAKQAIEEQLNDNAGWGTIDEEKAKECLNLLDIK